jgi:NTE family protein
VGLVLGSGSARGWAHIGVIRALEHAGVRPDIVCGTSIGALVGAAYAAGEIDRLEDWVRGLRVADVARFFDVGFSGGMIKGTRLMEFLRRSIADRPIEELRLPFGAVATALHTGAEVWLQHGSAVDAVHASIALPGLFSPVPWEGSFLVDGGLVNPVPVSLARAMGADIVIAVDLGSDILGRRFRAASPAASQYGIVSSRRRILGEEHLRAGPGMPSMGDVLATCMDIVHVRIGRSRMAGDPPDVVVAPRLAHLRLLDFHRGQEGIEEGRRAVGRVAHSLAVLGDLRSPAGEGVVLESPLSEQGPQGSLGREDVVTVVAVKARGGEDVGEAIEETEGSGVRRRGGRGKAVGGGNSRAERRRAVRPARSESEKEVEGLVKPPPVADSRPGTTPPPTPRAPTRPGPLARPGRPGTGMP